MQDLLVFIKKFFSVIKILNKYDLHPKFSVFNIHFDKQNIVLNNLIIHQNYELYRLNLAKDYSKNLNEFVDLLI